ncbi:MAG TPA: hypothetical protein VNR36_05285 [Pseudolysinimonas sp.]|nr:hypothetical protein [Pseudolysinimonas sp.]
MTLPWIIAIAVVAASILLAGLAIRLRRPALAIPTALPLAAGLLALVFGVDLTASDRLPTDLLTLLLATLGVLGGYPVTIWVLGLATPKRRGRKQKKHADDGEHGGILVEGHEVLRGGWVIGYLERVAVVVAVVLGRFEIFAALIAVKGLGRFSELDSSVARERFIIGTLTSLSWAAGFGLLIASLRA